MYPFAKPPARSEIPAEVEEINQLAAGGPVTAQERILLHDDVADGLKNWQEKSRDDEKFISSVESDLGNLAVTTFESPGDADPFFGAVNSSIKAIEASPTAFDFERKPSRPKFED